MQLIWVKIQYGLKFNTSWQVDARISRFQLIYQVYTEDTYDSLFFNRYSHATDIAPVCN